GEGDFYAVLLADNIADVTISGNEFHGNGHGTAGVSVWGKTNFTGPVTVEDNTITGFTDAGIQIRQNAGQVTDVGEWTVRRNRISGNAVGILHEGTGTLDAARNWWGAASGPTHDDNPGGSGDSISGDVTFSP